MLSLRIAFDKQIQSKWLEMSHFWDRLIRSLKRLRASSSKILQWGIRTLFTEYSSLKTLHRNFTESSSRFEERSSWTIEFACESSNRLIWKFPIWNRSLFSAHNPHLITLWSPLLFRSSSLIASAFRSPLLWSLLLNHRQSFLADERIYSASRWSPAWTIFSLKNLKRSSSTIFFAGRWARRHFRTAITMFNSNSNSIDFKSKLGLPFNYLAK